MKVIPYGHQYIDKDDLREISGVLKSEWITQGPKIAEFEKALCDYSGTRYAVVVSSGTAALHIAALAAGIKRGDEVITSPITFLASANCVLYSGGKPVFADVQKETINIDPVKILEKITKRTKAIIPVHFAGQPAEMEEICKLAKKRKLFVIEDAAHALGADYKRSKIGSCKYSDMTIFSFHPVKTITTGEGGAVLTNNRDFHKKLLILRNHGIVRDRFNGRPDGDWYYEMQSLGYNYRLTDFQAALGISQLRKIGRFIHARMRIVKKYRNAFTDNPYFDLLAGQDGVRSSHHLFPILLKDRYKNEKRIIFAKMRRNGLGVQVHYIPVYFHPYYKQLGYKKGICPIAEDCYQREISIPIYQSMSDIVAGQVIEKIRKVFRSSK